MSKKIIHEADFDITDLIKYATMAGLSAYAIKKIVQKYKRYRELKKFGVKGSKEERNQEARDIALDLVDAYSLRSKKQR